MIPYAGQFVASGGLSASNLDLTGSLNGPVDYPSFFANPELTFDVDGSASAAAAGVPEPSMWVMMLFGFAALGYVGCKRSPVGNTRSKLI